MIEVLHSCKVSRALHIVRDIPAKVVWLVLERPDKLLRVAGRGRMCEHLYAKCGGLVVDCAPLRIGQPLPRGRQKRIEARGADQLNVALQSGIRPTIVRGIEESKGKEW